MITLQSYSDEGYSDSNPDENVDNDEVNALREDLLTAGLEESGDDEPEHDELVKGGGEWAEEPHGMSQGSGRAGADIILREEVERVENVEPNGPTDEEPAQEVGNYLVVRESHLVILNQLTYY
jgi:hypothetical protein